MFVKLGNKWNLYDLVDRGIAALWSLVTSMPVWRNPSRKPFCGHFRGDGKPSMSGSRTSTNTPTSTPHTNHTTTTSNYYDHPPQRQNASTNNVAASHGYSDSTLSSGRGSDDGRGSSFYSHSRQESDLFGSSHGSHDGHLSSGDELHSRNGSHDSSDHSLTSK